MRYERTPAAIEETRQNPFITLEAIGEHLGSIHIDHTDEAPPARPGTTEYHVRAAEDGLQRLFQKLVLMLPDNFAWSEGGLDEHST